MAKRRKRFIPATKGQRNQLAQFGHPAATDSLLNVKSASRLISQLHQGVHGDPTWKRRTRAGETRYSTSIQQRNAVMRRDKACRYCGTRRGPWEIDHVFPIWYGGPTTLDNLVRACKRCNRNKGKSLVWWGIQKLADEDHAWAQKAVQRAQTYQAVERWAKAM